MSAAKLATTERKKYRKLTLDALRRRYGRRRGQTSAWEHMSEEQRRDAFMAQAAVMVMGQVGPHVDTLSLGNAQEIISACVTEDRVIG